MSALTEQPTGSQGPSDAGDAPTTAAARFRGWLRRSRFWLIVGGVFLLVCAFALSSTLGNPARSALDLAATNPAPNGAMAAAEILQRNGVGLTRTDSLSDTLNTLAAAGAAETTVLVYDPKSFLNADQAGQLRSSGARLVAIAPGPLTLAALNPQVKSAGRLQADPARPQVPAGCGNPDAMAAGSIDPGSSNQFTGPTSCFGGIVAQSRDGRFTAVGSTGLFRNDGLAKSGNAALALRLLGKDRNLVWYLPSVKDLASSDGQPSLSDLQPAWLAPLGVWLLIVGILAVLWRGRRDGPLVEEPLPVSVKAAETVLGRARLYQDGRALAQAADNLRAAALQRLAIRFRIGREASADAVVLAVLEHSALPEAEVRRILQPAKPASESQFLIWAQQLETLEREVEREP